MTVWDGGSGTRSWAELREIYMYLDWTRNYLGGRNCRKREIRIISIWKKNLHHGCTRTRWAAASGGGGARERRNGREEGSCRRTRGRGRRRVCIARIPDGSQSGGRTGGTESIGTGRERGRVASGTSETDGSQYGWSESAGMDIPDVDNRLASVHSAVVFQPVLRIPHGTAHHLHHCGASGGSAGGEIHGRHSSHSPVPSAVHQLGVQP